MGSHLHNGMIEARSVYTGRRVRIRLEGERIGSIETLEAGGSDKVAGEGEELWVAPGLVDMQINGYGGSNANLADAPMERRVETIKLLVRKVLASGTTTFCPTIITAGFQQVTDSMTAIRLACEQDQLSDRTIAGIHLEGPYISEVDGPRGAHAKEHARNPDMEEFSCWQQASGNRIALVTLAPERDGAIPFIRVLANDGILVSIGHTAASHDEIAAAAEAGARMSTHLGNGAHAQLPRHPNYIWSQLADDRLYASIVSDGHHLHPSVVQVMSKVKGDFLVLVSDAVHLAGMPPGKYASHVGGDVELLPSGRLQMVSNPLLLAGAAVSLAECVERYVQFTGASLSETFRKAAATPAQLLGLQHTGRLVEGGKADLILFHWNESDHRLDLQAVIKNGKEFQS